MNYTNYAHAKYFYRSYPGDKDQSKKKQFFRMFRRYHFTYATMPSSTDRLYSIDDYNAKVPEKYRVPSLS